MSSPRPKTPSPQPPANPTNTPMPPPPSSPPSTTPTPRTPSRTTSLASPLARNPGGTLSACSSDPAVMTVVKVHTAKCTECDKRNKDTMLRCPGCTFQICRPCRERREKKGRGLVHGAMMSPGGLGSGLGSGSGIVRRKVVGKMGTSPSAAPFKDTDEAMVDVEVETRGKSKNTSAGRKRAVKTKATPSDESDDDDFRPDLASPTANVAPTGRVQELLEANGVNTPGNRYDEHFLQRHDIVVTNPVISIPETVRRMAEPKPRLTAEQKKSVANNRKMEAANKAQGLTVRDVVNMETSKYQNGELSTDENDELASAIKETARKWGMRTYDTLPRAVQATVVRSLDMRLDCIVGAQRVQLAKAIEECAVRKLNEFEQDRAMSPSAGA
ncbi:hypothetical protein DE146DRAFT_624327 [Phaeosphaeria sp. MPI-PUGE-AT-0046c]|nr:hypothetical protein DE146DRAFT_624327 [Phaeosphaeria sp. MPI-PUGE-AT-0046c]